ncbi:MAG: hypothetical protein D6790_09850 [Caldilineae bacterium]|nr:MAG: hypothetical protein D6790_09850 [Caldilineae bacterium]
MPIILFSVLAGLGVSVLVFYALYAMLQIPLPWSAGLSVLALIGTVSGAAGGLGALYDRRTVGVHIGFSCTLTALVLAFAGLCMVVGMLAGALALLFGQP